MGHHDSKHASSAAHPVANPRRSRITRWTIALAGIGLIAAGAAIAYRKASEIPPRQLLRSARQALTVRDFALAEQTAGRVPASAIEFNEAMLIAGEAATKQDRFEQAILHYAKVPSGAGEQTATARYCTGDLLFQLRQASDAEEQYRLALAARPDDLWTHEQLASLLCSLGRQWEAIPHLFALARAQQTSIRQLLLLGDPESILGLNPDLEKFRSRAPHDPLPLVALAKSALNSKDLVAAARYAREALAESPELIEAWAILGRALAEAADDDDAFFDWHARVPKRAQSHPDVWVARGVWAREHDESAVAIRCFWEALQRFPDSRTACYHLGQALHQIKPPQTQKAALFLSRAERLEDLRNVLFMVFRQQTNPVHIQHVARLTEELGRLWEAAAWSQVALGLQPGLADAQSRLRRVSARLTGNSPRVIVELNPTATIDLTSFPLPGWTASATRTPTATQSMSAGTVRFEDSAAAAGIDFRYFNGSEPANDGKLIYQQLGGGVAAIDYDADLWPDLYFTQGAPAPNDDEEHAYRDRFYRNLGDGRFGDVTHQAGLGDGRHSLGIAAGDFDNDGFPDLYLANAGANRLYRNNGDGTFFDVTAQAGLTGRHCTASCLIADLNGDSWPELYDVNYLAEPEIYSLTCQINGVLRGCDPRLFKAEPDQLFLSLGNGRFEDISDDCGINVPKGNGLGIVAADFAGTGVLNLFVANDGTGNFYFVNRTARRGDRPLFQEAALEAGVAYDDDGRVQASMGIAADDVDGDGLIDLYVTNFYNQSSAFYHQTGRNVFEDARRRYGLREPTLFQLGFGTQFLDGELDGFPDLIATNGHIEDFSDEGKPYRMRPQYFRNLAGQRFEELKSPALGAFFAGEYLGRGLARLDWNGDGKEDAVISHLDTPAALLTNRTQPAGHFLALRLVGTESSRDAIGTAVSCRAAGRTLRRQLTAGDGYMASNERQLVFGLAECNLVDKLTIRWPSGRQQSFEQIKADCHWLAVEGRQALVRLPERVAGQNP